MNLSQSDLLNLSKATAEQLTELLSAAKYVREVWKLHLSSKMKDVKKAEEHELNCHLMLDKAVSKLLGEEQAFPNLEISDFDK